MKSCEIIIIKFNAPEVENACIESVKKYTKYPYKLTIYNNYPENEKLGVIWNRLIDKSKCEYICLLNSDTIVEPGWLSNMMRTIESDPLTAVIGPATNSCATIQNQGRGEGTEIVDSLAGFCYLLRKSAWKRAGKFDKRFGIYGQESALNYAIKRLGLRLKWQKNVFVKHLHGYSVKKADKNKLISNEKERSDGTRLFKTVVGELQQLKPKLAGIMIIKNEENFIENTLNHFLQIVEKVYIVDQYSTDSTLKILNKFRKKGLVEYIQSDEIEGKRRNLSYQLALKDNPDWVLWLDADEQFENKAIAEIIEQARDPEAISWGFPEFTMWSNTHYRCDNVFGRPIRAFSKRMFRSDPNLKWHETYVHPGDIGNFTYAGEHKHSDLRIKHFGYATPEIRQKKFYYYTQLDGHNRDYGHIIQDEKEIILELWQE